MLSQQRYMPFGEVRTDLFAPGAISQTDFGYTGQREVESMGLMDYKARFYDPGLGRFIQADTIVPNAADPQSWNRYAYVLNNSIRNADPSGHCVGPLLIACIALANALADYAPVVAIVAIGALWLGRDTRQRGSEPATWQEMKPRVEATLLLAPFTFPAFARPPMCARGQCAAPDSASLEGSSGATPVRGGAYTMRDPATGEIEYVGRTNNLARRQIEH